MPTTETQVLISGAGPTGLTLACDLARRNISFRVIDKSPTHFIGSKGKGLQPRSLEVFDDFGIVDDVLRVGKFHVPFRAYDGDKVLGEVDLHAGRNPTPSTPYASPLITPQWRVEENLRNLLHKLGGQVELSTELVSLTQDDDGVTAAIHHNGSTEQIHTKFLVAADGGRSFIRKFLDVPFEGETWKDERMYVGDVRLRGLDRDAWHSWGKHPDGWLALCPLPSTDSYQLQAQIPPDEEQEPSLDIFRRIVAERSQRSDIELIDASWTSLYRVNIRMVSRYRVGRVFLAGDAAHVHSPAGGQGMNTGIQDAYSLGWKLTRVLKGAPSELLDTYQEERLPVAATVLGISTKLHKQISGETEENLRRDAVTLQLGISYKEMSLSRRATDTKVKLSAGDRAPDAPGQTADGQPLRLFDLFRGPHFTLLRLFPSTDAAPQFTNPEIKQVDVRPASTRAANAKAAAQSSKSSAAETFIDSEGHFAAAYGGAENEFILVRPDGYIAWLGNASTLSDLQKYLATFNLNL
ncbi:MAG TPA: FAD-dependent oxidoreductase [Candidatus Acidoferrum sp.]|jgi:2-polyprenyl-6-methoxyphenol hydroxylase-like FAD-dependent oxidoreductase